MNRKSAPDLINVNHLRVACSSCSLRELCLPAGLDLREMERVDRLVNRRRKLAHGEHLYRSGTPLAALYAIRSGFMKSCVLHDDGREQVAGFHMPGDLLGLDAISTGRHISDTVALEDTEVCEIPFPHLERLARELPSLHQQLNRVLSREIARDYGVMLLLGSMKAEERLAAFLLNLSQRFAARGYSALEFRLRMTREEIGSYLGLKLETISRVLSRLAQEGLIEVRHKNVKILDAEALRRMLSQR
ncbi:MAG TPA: fumarate/nitrate reduction transcriptional regulator Fnr [Burkholderiales bacterium]|nr:fumarate/nitrate reduction transcriptional regulator Fnr [Burkholderiales bacterium]